MNEPKRRGRPPKAKPEVTEPVINGDESRQPEEVLPVKSFEQRQAQAYARRVWEGQSPDLSRHERLGRVAEALKGQGMSMDGVDL
jgi:hypothetical protein